MKKSIDIIIVLLLIGASVNAQSFFKALPKANKLSLSATSSGVFGTTQWNFRPVVNVVGYSTPGNQLSTGGGVGYELDSYDATTQKWTSIISFDALGWYNVPLAQQNPTNIIGYGAAVGLFNNLLMVGYKYSGGKDPSNFIVGIGINFNN